jgi:hypothetical protein
VTFTSRPPLVVPVPQHACGDRTLDLWLVDGWIITPAGASGSDRITEERIRQVEFEGYSPETDKGKSKELLEAATCYLGATIRDLTGAARSPLTAPWQWPWAGMYWKPTPGDPGRQLEKAGALVAAAIDSLDEVTE